jgi:hypothetical protein
MVNSHSAALVVSSSGADLYLAQESNAHLQRLIRVMLSGFRFLLMLSTGSILDTSSDTMKSQYLMILDQDMVILLVVLRFGLKVRNSPMLQMD